MAQFNMKELEPRESYQLLTRSVGPRPIAFVSTLSPDGKGNLAPFSYFNIGGSNPPSAMICPVKDRRSNDKDTLRNIRDTGQYVINIVTFEMVDRMSQTSWAYPHGVDEFELSGFSRAPSSIVKPPRVAESPISMEMELFKIVPHGEGPLSSNYIIGEVVCLHVADEFISDGLPDNARIEHVGRLGGDYYCRVYSGSLFTVSRPSSPASSSVLAG